MLGLWFTIFGMAEMRVKRKLVIGEVQWWLEESLQLMFLHACVSNLILDFKYLARAGFRSSKHLKDSEAPLKQGDHFDAMYDFLGIFDNLTKKLDFKIQISRYNSNGIMPRRVLVSF